MEISQRMESGWFEWVKADLTMLNQETLTLLQQFKCQLQETKNARKISVKKSKILKNPLTKQSTSRKLPPK
jgi:hypothetical protein